MNFVDPKEIDIPRHGTKNRYKTILPSKFLELNSLHGKTQAFPHLTLPHHFPSSTSTYTPNLELQTHTKTNNY